METTTARTGAAMTRSAVSPRLSASQRQNMAVRVLMMRGDEQESQEQAMTRSFPVMTPGRDQELAPGGSGTDARRHWQQNACNWVAVSNSPTEPSPSQLLGKKDRSLRSTPALASEA